MWPKALAQVLELLPHVSRLVPVADRFLNSRAANDEAGRQTVAQMQTMADGLRGDLSQVTASHAGLYRQMNEMSAKVDDAARDARAAQAAAEAIEARLARIEATQAKLARLTTAVITLLCLMVLVLPFVLYFASHR